MRPFAWGRLLRLSLAPSAAADAAAGLCLGHGGTLPLRFESLLVVGASLCVYHGGMVLNDWADRRGDARTRPDRPIPSGAVDPGRALAVAVALFLAGPLLAYGVEPALGAWVAMVAVLAALYDLVGRGPWLGPGLLAACRGLNLGAGFLAGEHLASVPWTATSRLAWIAIGLYAAYVLFASRLGRLEDDEDSGPLERRPSLYLVLACTCLLALPFLPLFGLDPAPERSGSAGWAVTAPRLGAPLALVVVGLFGLLVEARRREWTRALVGRATGMALRRLLVFTAACALLSALSERAVQMSSEGLAGPWVCGLILLGYPLSFALRRVFPPT